MTRPGPSPELTTTLEIDGERACFVVRTDVALYQERIVHMGWVAAEAPGTFVRRLNATHDVEAVHANFSRHLEELVLQSARLRPVQWDVALELMLERLEGSGIDWWVYGSTALAIRGLDVDPGDVDFTVSDAPRTGELFADVLVEPVQRADGWVADWTGRAFHGALFEWIAGPHARGAPHEQGPIVGFELEEIRWRDRAVLVPPLELQLVGMEERGLAARAAAIRAVLGHR